MVHLLGVLQAEADAGALAIVRSQPESFRDVVLREQLIGRVCGLRRLADLLKEYMETLTEELENARRTELRESRT